MKILYFLFNISVNDTASIELFRIFFELRRNSNFIFFFLISSFRIKEQKKERRYFVPQNV